MSVKLTREGKQCKLCLKKGGPCHIHAGKAVAKAAPKKAKAPAKRAAKKAKSKAKAKSRVVSTGVDRFATLPKDALTLILLAMDRPELTKVRKLSKRARAVSDTSSFKDQYHARHPTKFFTGSTMVRSTNPAAGGQRYLFSDSSGKSVLIKGRAVDAEDDSHTFLIDWMGYRTTKLPGPGVSPKARNAIHEWGKEINYKRLKPNTVIQSQQTVINEAIQLLTEELEEEGIVYDVLFA